MKETDKLENCISEPEREHSKNMMELWNKCEANKYLKKYDIYVTELSQSLSKFIVLLYNIEKDKNDNLEIKFYMQHNLCFGREYIRYSLELDSFFSKEIFIQIPYNEYAYQKGELFTIANVYKDLYENELPYGKGFRSDFEELAEKAHQDFVINKKRK